MKYILVLSLILCGNALAKKPPDYTRWSGDKLTKTLAKSYREQSSNKSPTKRTCYAAQNKAVLHELQVNRNMSDKDLISMGERYARKKDDYSAYRGVFDSIQHQRDQMGSNDSTHQTIGDIVYT